VVSGIKSAIGKLILSLEDLNCTIIPLNVSGPFHSNFMENAAKTFKSELLKYKFAHAKIPVLSNYTGEFYTDNSCIPDLLFNQMVSPVKWVDNVTLLIKKGTTFAVEMGIKPILTNMCRDIDKNIKCFPCRNIENIFDIR